MREHVPTVTMVTSNPDTVQTLVVVDVNVTARPELDVGDTENAVALHARSAIDENVIA